jgi:hypothetical protein
MTTSVITDESVITDCWSSLTRQGQSLPSILDVVSAEEVITGSSQLTLQ